MKSNLNKMIHDDKTYIESIGRQDRENVREALADKGADTVLRLCIGASTTEMPLRALGYAASAYAVYRRYFPEAQLQFVHPVHAASLANGVNINNAYGEAQKFEYYRQQIFPLSYAFAFPGALGTVGLSDSEESYDSSFTHQVREFLDYKPEVAAPLTKAAAGRDLATYAAAHLVNHDSHLGLQEMESDFFGDVAISSAPRIISIGAQSERKFYNARMACRSAGILPAGSVEATGQLFTKHVLPPYLHAREGEPVLSTFYQRERPLAEISTDHSVPSVQRDLEFLRGSLEEAMPGMMMSSMALA